MIADVNSASTTVTMNNNLTIQANFIATYTLTVVGLDGGMVAQPGIGTFTYRRGTVVNLIAVPEPLGYKFGNWQGDVAGVAAVNSASTTITMNGDYTITAKFNNVSVRTLTILSSGNGTVAQPGVGTFQYNNGTVVSLMAVPGSNSLFVAWIGGIGQIANTLSAGTSITITGDVTITATFLP
ncbi:MAG: hypothetical protein A2147_00855 [Chloroflexi bacterium RBG_16_57_8]|nr:MAG: hypothetical protein A2147_00855 [Chloroflexi bacterium RBG_16_57_8]